MKARLREVAAARSVHPRSRVVSGRQTRLAESATNDSIRIHPWATYVQNNIFSPLGLSRSYFGMTPPHLREWRSNGYTIRRDSAGILSQKHIWRLTLECFFKTPECLSETRLLALPACTSRSSSSVGYTC